jgi:hypothetical protein
LTLVVNVVKLNCIIQATTGIISFKILRKCGDRGIKCAKRFSNIDTIANVVKLYCVIYAITGIASFKIWKWWRGINYAKEVLNIDTCDQYYQTPFTVIYTAASLSSFKILRKYDGKGINYSKKVLEHWCLWLML